MSDLTFWQRLARNRLWDLGAALVALLALLHLATVLPGRAKDFDFNQYYEGGYLIRQGQNPYTTPIEPTSRQFGFVYDPEVTVGSYPPSFLWLFAPLTWLSPGVSFATWVAIEALCLVLILVSTRLVLGGGLSRRGWWLLAAGVVASPAVGWHFWYSQVQLLLAALVMGALDLHRRGRPLAACWVVTAAGMLKFYPFVFLPWFCWRGADTWRGRLRLALWSAAGGLLVVLVTGPALWRDFFRHGFPMTVGLTINRDFHYSLPALVTNLGLAPYRFAAPPAVTRFCWIAGTASGLLLIGWAYLWCWAKERDRNLEFGLLCIAVLAGTVTVQGHYLVWLIFPVALALVQLCQGFSWPRLLWFAGLVVLLNLFLPAPATLDAHLGLKTAISYVPSLGMLALGIALFRWRHPPAVSG